MSSISWYYARLRVMTPAEMLWRARQSAQRTTDWWRQRRPRPYSYYVEHGLRGQAIPRGIAACAPAKAMAGRVGLEAQDAARLLLGPAASHRERAAVAAAERIMQGTLDFFGCSWHYGPDWQWQRDPRNQVSWPRIHWTRIVNRGGGAKYVWEPSRFQHLTTLGRAWYWTGNSRYVTEIDRQITSWLDQNPPYQGIHWTSGIELAIRIVTWTWTLAFVGEADALREETKERLLAAVCLHADYLVGRLSAYSSANNHLIAEAAGLFIAGTAYPELPKARTWRTTGRIILDRELRIQVHGDGVNAEQALHYHGEVLEWYILAAVVDRARGGGTWRHWRSRLSAMAHFLAEISDEKGNAPAYGDSDDAEVLRLSDLPADYYRSLRITVAQLLGESAQICPDNYPDERAAWLCGSRRAVPEESVSSAQPHPSVALFPHGGWVTHRTPVADSEPATLLVFHAGPLGLGRMAAHGHADALSLWLSVGGTPMLIDPGTGTYHEDPQVRRYFRGTSAHNTVTLDSLDQSDQGGSMIWLRHAHSRLNRASGAAIVAQGRHDGYARRAGHPMHERTILYHAPNVYIVLDRIAGAGDHDLELNWHLPPRGEAAFSTDGACAVRVGEAQVVLRTKGVGVTLTGDVLCGALQPMRGWYSPNYGRYVPSPTVRWRGEHGLPVIVATVIDASASDPCRDFSIAGNAEQIEITLERRHRWYRVVCCVPPATGFARRA